MEKHRLTISDGTSLLTLPPTKSITHGGTLEASETVMLSGSIKADIVGFRMTVTYSYNYIPAADMAVLHSLLRSRYFFTCGYLDVDIAEKTGVFKISYPQTSVFMYKDGKAVWQNASLTLTAKEVKTCD